MSLEIIFTFCLKHLNYPFYAPIFHLLSETESYKNQRQKSAQASKHTSLGAHILAHIGVWEHTQRHIQGNIRVLEHI